MTHYEQILDKITPTFFKLEQYREYYDNHYTLMQSYLKYMKLPEVYHIYFIAKNIHYYFEVSYDEYTPFWDKTESGKLTTLTTTESGKLTTLTTKDMNIKETYVEMTFVEFIINMIINNFGFKNVYVYNLQSAGRLDNIFIALVGKDLYETLRRNIR